MSKDYLFDLFINEAKPAMNRHSGTGFVDPNDPTIILVDESGNSVTAVLVDEETVFDATPNDIREGKVAVTEEGVTVGTKEIPAYHTYDGFKIVQNGRPFELYHDDYDYTKFTSTICTFNKSLAQSVAAIKVAIDDSVYDVNSTVPLASVTKNDTNKSIELGINNETGGICVLRYIMYKEIY